MSNKQQAELVVIGGGPGGYTAAFEAAEAGFQTVLITDDARLGGVCLYRGCIPSKALLAIARHLRRAQELSVCGIHYNQPQINFQELYQWLDDLRDRLGEGLLHKAKQQNIEIISGRAWFESSKELRVDTSDCQRWLSFEKAIIASGSHASVPSALDIGHPELITSDQAFERRKNAARILVIGAGYIGLELSTVFSALGSAIDIVEQKDSILPGVDKDLCEPVEEALRKDIAGELLLSSEVSSLKTQGEAISATIKTPEETLERSYDRILVAVGRNPNTELGLEKTSIRLDEGGAIEVSYTGQTNDPEIFAIGDVAGEPMLAHAAEFQARSLIQFLVTKQPKQQSAVVPKVVFTDPEIAWCGLTEREIRARDLDVEVTRCYWSSSGRAHSLERADGLTKLIYEPRTRELLGVGIVGHDAGELISEAVLAIEMGAVVDDLADTIHPHPTLSETIMLAAQQTQTIS